MLLKLILLFTVLPFVELAVLLYLAQVVGGRQTLLVIVLTGLVGGTLAKFQGWQAWQRIKKDLSMGIVPSGRLVDGFLILIGGLLLLTPGILTDLVGLGLLIPDSRGVIKKKLRDRFRQKVTRTESYVDVEYWEEP